MRDCSYCVDGTPHLHMSDLGSCVRSQAAVLQGFSTVEPPAMVQDWYARGHLHEVEMVATMRAQGWAISGEQAQVQLPTALLLVGHLDAMGGQTHRTDPTYERIIEGKAPSAWQRFETAYKTNIWTDPLMYRYAIQTSCYAHSLDREVIVACVEDGRIKTFVIEVPIVSLDDIKSRVDAIVQAGQQGGLPACTQRDFPCPTVFLCDHQQDERVTLDDPTLADYLHRYTELSATVAAGEKAKKARDQLARPEIPVGRYVCEGIDLTVYVQNAPDMIDRDAMKADGVYDKYRKEGKQSTRWKVGS